MSAMIGLLPGRRAGVYILANRDHAEVRHALLFRAFDLVAGRPPRDWSQQVQALYADLDARGREGAAAFARSRVEGTKPSLELSRYAGTYVDSLNGTVEVALRDGGLHLRWGSGFVGRMEHRHFDSFIARWDDRRNPPSPVTFFVDASARATEVRVRGATFHRVNERSR